LICADGRNVHVSGVPAFPPAKAIRASGSGTGNRPLPERRAMYEICKRLILIAGGLASMIFLILALMILVAWVVTIIENHMEK